MQYYSPREAVFVTKTVKNMVIAALMLQKELQQKVSFRNYQMWTCAKIPVGFAESVDHIYIKGKCPQTWSDTYIKSKCEMDLQIQVDYMQQIPVLGKRTNITYTNVYCAICNNDDEIHQWNVTVSCEGGISEKALKNSNFLSITNYDSASKNAHNMLHTVIQGTRLYNNEYCVKCNDITNTDVSCFQLKRRRVYSSSRPVSSLDDYGSSDYGYRDYPSISVLFHIKHQTEDKCKATEIFDLLRNRCIKIKCGRLFKLEGGHCIKDTSKSFLNNSITSDCETISLLPGEYSVSSNQSIWVNHTQKIYGRGEYEFSHNIRDLSIHFNSMSNVAFNIVRIDTKVEKSTWKKPHEFVSIVTLGTVYIYIWNK
ncbi:hypothetical protein GQR58_017573 [Nymphon striatum]|nr:hypothetical protein GQR58_017573 [Nymphon striatum]